MSLATSSSSSAMSPAKRPQQAAAPGTSAQSVAKRLQSELMSLMMNSAPGISAFPQGENLFHWIGTIEGSKGTVYEGMTFKLSVKFPENYPYTAPTVKFETPCFHPNVDMYGNICLDILKDQWSAIYNISTILLSIQSLLGEPNNDSPLNGLAATLWANQEEYRKVLKKKYEEAMQAQQQQKYL
eukprot:GEZU01024493.1.p1 GENE.GEZU01024493.1~~GEZU01024493.1.p1  ORF type:complete len:184 (-),score=77.09 GEZU01024493.1:122-673(-)